MKGRIVKVNPITGSLADKPSLVMYTPYEYLQGYYSTTKSFTRDKVYFKTRVLDYCFLKMLDPSTFFEPGKPVDSNILEDAGEILASNFSNALNFFEPLSIDSYSDPNLNFSRPTSIMPLLIDKVTLFRGAMQMLIESYITTKDLPPLKDHPDMKKMYEAFTATLAKNFHLRPMFFPEVADVYAKIEGKQENLKQFIFDLTCEIIPLIRLYAETIYNGIERLRTWCYLAEKKTGYKFVDVEPHLAPVIVDKDGEILGRKGFSGWCAFTTKGRIYDEEYSDKKLLFRRKPNIAYANKSLKRLDRWIRNPHLITNYRQLPFFDIYDEAEANNVMARELMRNRHKKPEDRVSVSTIARMSPQVRINMGLYGDIDKRLETSFSYDDLDRQTILEKGVLPDPQPHLKKFLKDLEKRTGDLK